MIKLVIATRRRPGMTGDEFRRYVKDVHGLLVVQDPDNTGVIRKYVQNHVFDAGYGSEIHRGYPAVSERDIITELWFDGPEQIQQARSTPMYRETIGPDEDNFADQSSVLALVVREEDVAVPRPRVGRIKVVHYIKVTASVPDEEFARQWREAHAAIMAEDVEVRDALAGYVQNHVLPVPRGGADDRNRYGIAMMWFESRYALAAFYAYRRRLETFASHTARFMDPSRSFFVFTEEFVLRDADA